MSTSLSTNIKAEIQGLEQELSLPTGFYDKLLAEDDWSFLIKLSALFEAACTQALTAKLMHPEIQNALSHIEQAHPKYGKITLLLKLNVINNEQYDFLKKLAELRNKIVHNVSDVNFTFKSHICNMDKNQKKQFVKHFGHGIKESFNIDDASFNRTEVIVENTKLAIWVTANEVLACLHLDIRSSKNIAKVHEITNKIIHAIAEDEIKEEIVE